jgi:hypothetical protein
VGTFLAQDQPGPVRPGRQVHQCGGVGHPGAVADAAVGLDRRIPRAGGVEHLGGVTDAGVDRAAKGEPDVLFPAGGGEAVSGAGRVGADQNPWCVAVFWIRAIPQRQRVQRLTQYGDVIGGGVAARVAGPQQPGQRFPGSDVEAVQNTSNGWCPKVFFQVAAAFSVLSE